jgi:hypothetical protein
MTLPPQRSNRPHYSHTQEVAEAEAAVEEYKKSVQQSSMDEAQQQK